MLTTDFGEIFEFLESYPRKMIDVRILIQMSEMPRYKIKNRDIRRERELKREHVVEELQKLVQMKENYKGTY